ncbi:MAG TPA: glycosyltransferase family 4 protein [Solirubrobacteraceae bacterium]|nr:glycosyltransferase family 4 protein [Solirubrobacteraceae bacterium]
MIDDLAESEFDEPRKRIAVVAGRGLTPAQERTLGALEGALPVSFLEVSGTEVPDGADGVLVLGLGSCLTVPTGPPRLVLATAAGPGSDSPAPGEGASLPRVALADDSALERSLRGRRIQEGALPAAALPPVPAVGTELARLEGRTVWWQVGDDTPALGVSAYPLAELAPGGTLRDHLRARCFMGLLPLVHFIRRLVGPRWSEPGLRASFVIDDPNLHRTSYGFLDYRELAAHATRHCYHVGFATVPLDGWLVNRRAASLLAESRPVLSLSMHGNDHAAHELGRLDGDERAARAIAQALRRVASLERRSGVAVERVMVPPYEDCSEPALRAMFRLGIEAACVSRPHPWYVGPPSTSPLAGWHPAELVAGGIPVLPRYPLSGDRDDLPLRAFLGQPLILYGHHWDFAEGLDLLARAAAEINGLGDVEWGPLGWIARTNFATRAHDGTLLVRMHARRVAVRVPAGVRSVRVLVGEPTGGSEGHRVSDSRSSAAIEYDGRRGISAPIATEGRDRLELTLAADRPLGQDEVRPPGVRPWLAVRRALVEGRDRLQPIRRRRRRPGRGGAPAGAPPTRPVPILFSVHSGKLGGAERMALLEAERLGSRFELLLAVPDGPLRPRFAAHGELVAGAATLPLWGASPRRWLSGSVRTVADAIRMARLIRRRGVELVLTNSSVSVAPVLAAKLAGVPVIVHARDVPKSRLAPLVLAAQGRLADTVIVIADALAPYFRARSRTRVVRINDGIRVPAESRAPGRVAFGSPVRLCLIGGIDPRKGQDVAIAALAQLREQGIAATVELVGRDVDEGFAACVRADARRLGLAGQVEFAGEVDDVEEHLSRADIVVAPSRDEWTPLVLMEALVRAKPVVATRVGAVADVVRDGESGLLVAPESPTELATAVARLVSDPVTAGHLAERGSRLVRAEFGVERTLEGVQTEVDRLLSCGFRKGRERRPPEAVV